MAKRIRRILLISSNYDSYALEEDGRIEARITKEYSDLNLSNPPVIVRAETTVEALALVEGGEHFDLIITMYNVGEVDVFSFAEKMKKLAKETPIVLLTSFSRELYRQIEEKDTSSIDYMFCWMNSPDLIIAIIKLLEDKLNAEEDILGGGVQAILLVEDSVRYYSTYLPLLYKIVLQQNIDSVKEALNENQQIARKRARPKILLATSYNEAVDLFNRYSENLLGVISDIGFVVNRGDRPETEKLDAGIDLCDIIRKKDPKMPILLQSSQESMRSVAESLGVGFVVKKSKTLTAEVSEYIGREFAFGDFTVTDPATGEVTGRARDLRELEDLLGVIDQDQYAALVEKNYVSKWMFARGLFSIAKIIRPLTLSDTLRQTTVKAIRDYRVSQALGVVAKFDPETFNDTISFSKLGEGSVGGKARGLSFLNHILQKYDLYDKWEGVRVTVPRTLVVTTDYFDTFIEENGLRYVINSDFTDEEILSEFVASTLPKELTEALRTFISGVRKPLAVRSSSKLEDSYYQPFAGVYSTYMIPVSDNQDQQLRMLAKAIKSVYASVYYASSRSYITASANVISEEKMAVIVEEICGKADGGLYYPTLSGVARSINFYPIGHEKAEEGIVKMAYGLGKAVVDGENVLRFSPAYPKNVLQTSTPELTMSDTQKAMYALDMDPEKFRTSVDDAINLRRIPVSDCGGLSDFRKVVSTWDFANMRMVDSAAPEGPKFITFAQMLRYGTFPVADIVSELIRIAKEEMKCEVEIEFAADIPVSGDDPAAFNVLQIRPISADSRRAEINWSEIDTSKSLILSSSALGTGWIEGVRDIVYLKKESFDILKTTQMVPLLRAVNEQMRKEGRSYVLVGYGRWGSSIPSLGVPVKWGDISEVRVIVECSTDELRADPSQGTHFFQNLTSFNAGYVNVDRFSRGGDVFDYDALQALPAVYEDEFLRRVSFDHDLRICIDGLKNKAFVA